MGDGEQQSKTLTKLGVIQKGRKLRENTKILQSPVAFNN